MKVGRCAALPRFQPKCPNVIQGTCALLLFACKNHTLCFAGLGVDPRSTRIHRILGISAVPREAPSCPSREEMRSHLSD